jgi:hypothetical protein
VLIRRSAVHGDQPLWRLAALAPCRFGAIYLHISQSVDISIIIIFILFFIVYLGRGHAPSSASLYFSYT